MNKPLFIFLFLCYSAMFAEKTTILGKINNISGDSLTLTLDKLYVGQAEILQTKAANNTFSFQFELDRPRPLVLHYANRDLALYIEPGDDLQVNIDGEKSVIFEGKGAIHNKALTDFYTQFAEPFDKTKMTEKAKTSTVDVVEMYLFDMRNKQKDFLKTYPEKANLSAGFIAFLENEITYNYYQYIIGHPIVVANSKKDMLVNRLPSTLLEGITDKLANNNEAIINAPYRDFLVYFVTYFTSENNKFLKFTDYSESLNSKYNCMRQRLEGEAFQYGVAHFLFENCEKISPDVIKKMYGGLSEWDKTNRYTTVVNKKCADYMNAKPAETAFADKDKKGKTNDKKGASSSSAGSNNSSPASMFKARDLEGNEVSIEQFKGKVVYVDFWASWCGPCRQQFPFAKELHHKFSSKDLKKLVFLYISIDDGEERWKKAIEQFGIEGFHTLSPGGWGSEACRVFGISSIPRYMLIDKKGNIVDANAPRPGSEEIYGKIADLLKQK